MSDQQLLAFLSGSVMEKVDVFRYYKRIALLDENLNTIRLQWTTADFRFELLPPGIYNLRVSLPTGVYKDEIVSLSESQSVNIRMRSDMPDLFKNQLELEKDKYSDPEFAVSAQLFSMREGYWARRTLFEITNEYIDADGKFFQLSLEPGHHAISLTGSKMPRKFICVPPMNQVTLFIRRSTGPADVVHPVEVILLISDTRSQSFLTLLNRGALTEARELINSEDVAAMLWETMLRVEKGNPAVAIIGGYYLLKIRELEKLRDWPFELARKFPLLPDGCIIYAWQLILQREQEDLLDIRSWLLKAVERGIPVYTQGLRLLYDGLTMVAFHYGRKDAAIERALQRVAVYISRVDWSRETTTLIGYDPVNAPPGNGGPVNDLSGTRPMTYHTSKRFRPGRKGRRTTTSGNRKNLRKPKRVRG